MSPRYDVTIWVDLPDRLGDAPLRAARLHAIGRLADPDHRCQAATAHRTRCTFGASTAGLCWPHSQRSRLLVRERAAVLAAREG